MIKKLISFVMIVSISCTSILTGCNTKSVDLIPEKIVAKAMEADKDMKTYYCEGKMQMYENDKLMSDASIKIWNDMKNSVLRARCEVKLKDDESISTNDGNKMIVYSKRNNSAFIMDSLGKDGNMPLAETPKETFINLMGNLKGYYNISTVNEEKINGFNTIHMIAKAKEKSSITGDMEFWIDKETWFVVKTVSQVSNVKSIFEYTKVDTKVKMDESLFTQKLPADVKLENMDSKANEKKCTLKEASDLLKNPVLYVPDSLGYKLVDVKYLNSNNKEFPVEIMETYEINKKQAFTISAVLPKTKTDDDFKIPGFKKIKVRGIDGGIVEMDGYLIYWEEKNLNYSVTTYNPEISLNEIKNVIENMIYTK